MPIYVIAYIDSKLRHEHAIISTNSAQEAISKLHEDLNASNEKITIIDIFKFDYLDIAKEPYYF